MPDGRLVRRDAVVVATRWSRGPASWPASGAPAEHPNGVASTSAADPTGRTAVPGVWVAGNVTDLVAQVGAAAAGWATAAAHINADLVAEDTARAVAAYRDTPSAMPAPA